MPEMHIEITPAYELDAIKAAVARDEFYLTDYALEGWLSTGLTMNEVRSCIATLDAACFHRSLVSTAPGHEGEVWDWYIRPLTERRKRRGLSFKFVLEEPGRVRIFSLHWSKVKP